MGRCANRPKVISPGSVRKMLGLTLAQMGVLVGGMMGRPAYHRSTIAHWERSERRYQQMPSTAVDVYHQLIRDAVRSASGGRYVAQVANRRKWRVTLKRVA